MYSNSFPPIANDDSRILILGSMPGQASLRDSQYYAHPRNAFWPILCTLLDGEKSGADKDASYQQRLNLLLQRGVAVWDVMANCYRRGSLDADIAEDSIEPNQFSPFLQHHQKVSAIYFNGAKAEQSFNRYVLADIAPLYPDLHYQRLPSTSPAHASQSFEQKLAAWRNITEYL